MAWRPHRSPSFRKVLLATLVGLVVGSMALLGGVSFYFYQRLAQERVGVVLRITLNQVEERLDQLIQAALSQDAFHRRLLGQNALSAADFPRLFPAMLTGFEARTELSYVGVGLERTGEYCMLERRPDGSIRMRGTLRDAANRMETREFHPTTGAVIARSAWDGYDARERPHYRQAKAAGQSVWTDMYLFWKGHERGEIPGVTYATPVYDARQQLVAVLDVDFDTFTLSAFLAQLDAQMAGYAFLVEETSNGSRRLIAHPNPHMLRDPRTGSSVVAMEAAGDAVARTAARQWPGRFHDLAARTNVSARFTLDGKTYRAGFKVLRGAGRPNWMIVTTVNEGEVAGAVKDYRFWVAVIFCAVTALVAVIAWWLGARVAEPLRRLQRETEALSEGRAQLPLRVDGPEEVTRLGDAFNTMAESVLSRRMELTSTNEALREEIGHREQAQAAISKSAARLRQANAALLGLAQSRALQEGDAERAFAEVTEAAVRGIDVARASVWRFQAGRTSLHCCDLYESASQRHSEGSDLSARDYPEYFRALETERLVAAHDARTDPRTRAYTAGYLEPLGITSMLDAAVRLRGQVVGVLCVEHVGPARKWEPEEEVFVGSLADLVSLAIETQERRRAEEEVRELNAQLERRVAERTAELAAANERLKELDRLKSEFLATMSHELRTPLNSIIGFTGIVKQGMAGPVNEEQKKQLEMVYGSARHLLALINDLLDLSRIESGRMEVDHQWFKPAEVLLEVERVLYPMVAAKGLKFIQQTDDPALRIFSDRKKFYQVLLNVANNAVKFTEHGEVRVTCAARDGRCVAQVIDTGPGIKPENLALLFEAFRQVDGSARRVYEGTGLGLYLCRQLLHLLQGQIEAQSEYGHGSCFTFWVPIGDDSKHS